jgi:uncharacterized protein YeaO (DUF488 family)
VARRKPAEELDDVERLRLFDHEVEVLGQRRLIARGMENNFNITWSAADQQLRMSATEHDEDDLRAFCTDYRKFIAQDSPVNLRRIYNILERRLTSEWHREQLRESREAWRTAQEGGGVSVTSDDRRVTPEDVMDAFINGWVFHMDADKRRLFDRLWPHPITKFQMNNLIVEACRQLFYVQLAVRVAIRDGLLS